MIDAWKKLFEYSNSTCHTENRWGFPCFVRDSSALQLYLAWAVNSSLYLDNAWVLATNNSACIEKSLMLDYYNIVNQFNGQQQSCPVYICTNYIENWQTDQCINFETNIYSNQLISSVFIHSCSEGNLCNTQGLTNITCTAIPEPSKYPGEYCEYGEECFSQNCYYFKCKGAAVSQICANASACDPGLYCNAGTCLTLLAQGDICTNDQQCGTYSVCNLNQCTLQYSLYIGEPASLSNKIASFGYAPACTTGFASTNTQGAIICNYPPTSAKALPSKCTVGQMCQDSTGTMTKPCQCGLNGASYCPAFEGDMYLRNAIKNFLMLQQTKINCNSMTGPSALCYWTLWNQTTQFYYYYTNFTYYQQLPMLQGNLNCVQNSYTYNYWQAIQEMAIQHNDTSIAFKISAGIIGIVFANLL